eukprot:TRINITY_DN12164_c0_g2_i1.p1 TRINITY_DN12164_c0_g2~~TRINITY_DN12164_c0_g2_i1.p1  ORF type:complete len:365 (+),score=57.48 TRINITY_DN12164_c0_g2_i1:937-2031(+)
MGDYSKLPAGMSVIDPQWELIDPTPNIHELFLQFNQLFFYGKLSGIEVKWSPRMTLCAGVCSFDGQLCSVRLSQPLLKLRPRADLINTLLHEMIHAYLFLSKGERDRESHGPIFHQHMARINEASGANITVYHTFKDEVDVYRTHWWKCDGPCQHQPPYFGIVKRAMNRPPSSRDPWFARHSANCGGTFTKIKEPDGYGQRPRPADIKNVPNIKDMFQKAQRKRSSDASACLHATSSNATRAHLKANTVQCSRSSMASTCSCGETAAKRAPAAAEQDNFGNSTRQSFVPSAASSTVSSANASMQGCPVCGHQYPPEQIQQHVESCLDHAAAESKDALPPDRGGLTSSKANNDHTDDDIIVVESQ